MYRHGGVTAVYSYIQACRSVGKGVSSHCLSAYSSHGLPTYILSSSQIGKTTFPRSIASKSNFRRYTAARSSSRISALNRYKDTYKTPAASHQVDALYSSHIGTEVVLHGYVSSVRIMSKKLVFVDLSTHDLKKTIQLVATSLYSSHGVDLGHVEPQTAVAVHGIVQAKKDKTTTSPESDKWPQTEKREDIEIKLSDFFILNDFPPEIRFTEMSTFGSEQRHLQIRHSRALRDALAFRSKLSFLCRKFLMEEQQFIEIETPQLFKSTPEGAREFLVPTRSPEQAYALPQSPQQYKQILMASGLPRYFQIARCFRDEDLRADRQPEFTQLDLEMSFARGHDVMTCIEGLVKRIWKDMMGIELETGPFMCMSYHNAMAQYGSDKPDTRLGMEISRIGHLLPADLITKIGPLTDPVVEVFKFSPCEDAGDSRSFISDFMLSPEAAPFISNPEGQPGIFIFDPRKPLSGLSPFGFEAAEQLENEMGLEEGDVVVIQAREDVPFTGGSTPLGNLRLALHRAAVSKGLLEKATGWSFLWVNDFPLFSPTNDVDPGQGGEAGLAATHHPFTAPRSAADVDLLATDPLAVKAEHYDLVLNGVEIGGGSQRIHQAAMQEYIFRDVLKMCDERLQHFRHLLDVLRAGCPPHAGIALGFDRLCAVMVGSDSIRDVIAFPKDGRGRDALVGSPSTMTEEQLATYNLRSVKSGVRF